MSSSLNTAMVLPQGPLKRSGGIPYFARKLSDGSLLPMEALRYPTEITIGITEEAEPVLSFEGPSPVEIDRLRQSLEIAGTMTIQGVSGNTLAMWMIGAYFKITQPSATVTDELIQHTALQALTKLGRSASNPMGVRLATITAAKSDAVAVWSATSARALGAKVKQGARAVIAIVGGITGAVVPTWPVTLGGEVVDGTVTWRDIGPHTYAPGDYIADVPNAELQPTPLGAIAAAIGLLPNWQLPTLNPFRIGLLVSYSVAAATIPRVAAASQETIEGYFEYRGADGKEYVIGPDVRLAPTGDLAVLLTGSEPRAVTFALTFRSKDPAINPVYVDQPAVAA